jgi:Arc/MetJ family transcription regulator
MSRITIDLDGDLVSQTLAASGLATKEAAIEEAMREFISTRRRAALIERIKRGDLGIDLTMEELRKMRGKD